MGATTRDIFGTAAGAQPATPDSYGEAPRGYRLPAATRLGTALIVHGTADEKLGIHLARWAREQLERFPLALTYRELPMGHAITTESLAVVTTWLSASLEDARRVAHP